MNLRISFFSALGAFTILGSPEHSDATVVKYIDAFSSGPIMGYYDTVIPIQLPMFDPRLGALRSVTISAFVDVTMEATWDTRVTRPPDGIIYGTGFYRTALVLIGADLANPGLLGLQPQSDDFLYGLGIRINEAGHIDRHGSINSQSTLIGSVDDYVGTGDIPRSFVVEDFKKYLECNGDFCADNQGRPTYESGGVSDYRVSVSYDFTPSVAPVPEPPTWAMMLAGLVLGGATMRSKRCRRATAIA